MDWMKIQDGLGAPISADNIYQRFIELSSANAKARFMRDYRLLPYGDNGSYSLCDDARELDAVSDVMDVCARLAAIAGGMGDGERKATLNDLDFISGFEKAAGGAFLHINLDSSYWYKRFLYSALRCDYVLGDRIAAPIRDRDLIDASENGESEAPIYEHPAIEPHMQNTGSFDYSPAVSESTIEALTKDEVSLFEPSILSDITARRAFRSFSPVPDLRFRGTDITTSAEDFSACFWTDNELVIRAAGADLRGIAGDIAHALLLMHTSATLHVFSFMDGFSLSAPMGVCALWADFAQDVAKRPICICKTCGRPVVETHAPRGLPRVYCSDACRMKDKRREKKRAQERASAAK